MSSGPRPRRTVSSKRLLAYRLIGWRYSTAREAWVFAPQGGRRGPVLRTPEEASLAIPYAEAGVAERVAILDYTVTADPPTPAEPALFAEAVDGPTEPLALLEPLAAAESFTRRLAALAIVAEPAPDPPRPLPRRVPRLAAEATGPGTRWPFLTTRRVSTTPEPGVDRPDAVDLRDPMPTPLPRRVSPASRAALAPGRAPSRTGLDPERHLHAAPSWG